MPEAISALPTDPVKAFLSHSSADKPFVSAVARQLGRARVKFDVWEFTGGTKLSDAIRAALSKSTLFVFFASRSSIESTWAKFEAEEAEELLRVGVLKSALRQDLLEMRSVLNQYTLDNHRRPHSLHDLVIAGYLKRIPLDPTTGRKDTWIVDCSSDPVAPGIVSITSGYHASAVTRTARCD